MTGLDIFSPLKGLALDEIFPHVFLHLFLSPPAVPRGEGRLISAWRPLWSRSSPEGGASADDPGLVSDTLRYVCAPEEPMVLHTFLPEVFTMVPLVKIEFHDILVITLK